MASSTDNEEPAVLLGARRPSNVQVRGGAWVVTRGRMSWKKAASKTEAQHHKMVAQAHVALADEVRTMRVLQRKALITQNTEAQQRAITRQRAEQAHTATRRAHEQEVQLVRREETYQRNKLLAQRDMDSRMDTAASVSRGWMTDRIVSKTAQSRHRRVTSAARDRTLRDEAMLHSFLQQRQEGTPICEPPPPVFHASKGLIAVAHKKLFIRQQAAKETYVVVQGDQCFTRNEDGIRVTIDADNRGNLMSPVSSPRTSPGAAASRPGSPTSPTIAAIIRNDPPVPRNEDLYVSFSPVSLSLFLALFSLS
jgi:hypothetical protein